MTESLIAPSVGNGANALVVCDNLIHAYHVESKEISALRGFDLQVEAGEIVAIVGRSGSGKSALLNVLSGREIPTGGAARVAGWDLVKMSPTERRMYRQTVVGFVPQESGKNLLPHQTVQENVMLPMASTSLKPRARHDRAALLLDIVGVAPLAEHHPDHLSGGDQQRVAIAVALANQPQILLVDEPSGDLDSATGDEVIEVLRSANRDLGVTIIMATRDSTVSGRVRTVAIRDGRASSEVNRFVDWPTRLPASTYPLIPAASPTPRVHFTEAPVRPDPREQAAIGHPLVDRIIANEELPIENHYTPRVPPPDASKANQKSPGRQK
jgi:ABC-type lipoprotein export system ATPase subunit